MSKKITGDPTPIQQNSIDVAINLLNIHRELYSLAEVCIRKSVTELHNLIPEEILSKIGSFSSGSW